MPLRFKNTVFTWIESFFVGVGCCDIFGLFGCKMIQKRIMKHECNDQHHRSDDLEDIQMTSNINDDDNDKDPEIQESPLKRSESTIAMIANELCGKNKHKHNQNNDINVNYQDSPKIMHDQHAFCLSPDDDIDLTEEYEGDTITMTAHSTISSNIDLELQYPSDITTSIDIEGEDTHNDTHKIIDLNCMSV